MDDTFMDFLDFSIYDNTFTSPHMAHRHASKRTHGHLSGQQYVQELAEENQIPTIQVC